MKKLSVTILLLLIFVLCSSAKTVSLGDYSCLPNDALDDAPCVQEAAGDLPDGGTLRVTEGNWHLDTQVDLTQSGNYISFDIVGDKGAVFQLGAPDNVALFYAGNVNQLSFKKLIFRGTTGAPFDAAYLVYVTFTSQTLIENNQFFGIRVKEHLIYAGNSDVTVRGNQFDGNASKSLIYGANNLRSLVIENNTFIDYANFKNEFLSKTSFGNEAWIWIDRATDTEYNGSSPYVSIRNNRLDEGAYYAIKAFNLDSLDVSNAVVNVGLFGGIYLSNVKRARITSGAFGYNTNPVPAVTALNGTTAILDNVKLGAAVFYYTKDGTSSVLIK